MKLHYKVESSLKKHIAKEHPDPEPQTTESSQHIVNLSTSSAGSAVEKPVKQSSSATIQQLCSKKQKTEYKCDQCDKSYDWHKSLVQYTQMHGDRLPCTVCGHTFSMLGRCVIHMKKFHPEVERTVHRGEKYQFKRLHKSPVQAADDVPADDDALQENPLDEVHDENVDQVVQGDKQNYDENAMDQVHDVNVDQVVQGDEQNYDENAMDQVHDENVDQVVQGDEQNNDENAMDQVHDENFDQVVQGDKQNYEENIMDQVHDENVDQVVQGDKQNYEENVMDQVHDENVDQVVQGDKPNYDENAMDQVHDENIDQGYALLKEDNASSGADDENVYQGDKQKYNEKAFDDASDEYGVQCDAHLKEQNTSDESENEDSDELSDAEDENIVPCDELQTGETVHENVVRSEELLKERNASDEYGVQCDAHLKEQNTLDESENEDSDESSDAKDENVVPCDELQTGETVHENVVRSEELLKECNASDEYGVQSNAMLKEQDTSDESEKEDSDESSYVCSQSKPANENVHVSQMEQKDSSHNSNVDPNLGLSAEFDLAEIAKECGIDYRQ